MAGRSASALRTRRRWSLTAAFSEPFSPLALTLSCVPSLGIYSFRSLGCGCWDVKGLCCRRAFHFGLTSVGILSTAHAAGSMTIELYSPMCFKTVQNTNLGTYIQITSGLEGDVPAEARPSRPLHSYYKANNLKGDNRHAIFV